MIIYLFFSLVKLSQFICMCKRARLILTQSQKNIFIFTSFIMMLCCMLCVNEFFFLCSLYLTLLRSSATKNTFVTYKRAREQENLIGIGCIINCFLFSLISESFLVRFWFFFDKSIYLKLRHQVEQKALEFWYEQSRYESMAGSHHSPTYYTHSTHVMIIAGCCYSLFENRSIRRVLGGSFSVALQHANHYIILRCAYPSKLSRSRKLYVSSFLLTAYAHKLSNYEAQRCAGALPTVEGPCGNRKKNLNVLLMFTEAAVSLPATHTMKNGNFSICCSIKPQLIIIQCPCRCISNYFFAFLVISLCFIAFVAIGIAWLLRLRRIAIVIHACAHKSLIR